MQVYSNVPGAKAGDSAPCDSASDASSASSSGALTATEYVVVDLPSSALTTCQTTQGFFFRVRESEPLFPDPVGGCFPSAQIPVLSAAQWGNPTPRSESAT